MCRAAKYCRDETLDRLSATPSERSPRGPAEIIVLNPGPPIAAPQPEARTRPRRTPWRRSLGAAVCGLVVCVAFATPALGGDLAAADPAPSAFDAVDRNRDGGIDLTEIRLSAYQMFATMDRNRDNSLSLDELGRDGQSAFWAADGNRDNGLSLDEFLDAHVVSFGRIAGERAAGVRREGLTDW